MKTTKAMMPSELDEVLQHVALEMTKEILREHPQLAGVIATAKAAMK